MRLHPYLTERMLAVVRARWPRWARSPSSTTSASTARAIRAGSPATRSRRPGRILAAADAYHAMTEPRPHRAARTADGGRGRAARGRPRRARSTATRPTPCCARRATASSAGASWPAGLTSREVEVLRLLVRGLSNKEIAEQLVISRKTAGNHVEHIYAKIGVSNRARASLFAIKHGLMAAE